MVEKDYIDKSSPLPYYVQLKNILLEKINEGEFANGKLSSEHELSGKYNITVTTVRKTLSELKNEGRIYKIKGLGTFLNKPKLEIDFSKYLSFGRTLKEKGIKEGKDKGERKKKGKERGVLGCVRGGGICFPSIFTFIS